MWTTNVAPKNQQPIFLILHFLYEPPRKWRENSKYWLTSFSKRIIKWFWVIDVVVKWNRSKPYSDMTLHLVSTLPLSQTKLLFCAVHWKKKYMHHITHQPVSARSEQSDIKCRRNGFPFIGAAMLVKLDWLFHCHSQIIRILKLKIRKLYSLISTLHDLKGLSMQKEMSKRSFTNQIFDPTLNPVNNFNQ